MKRLQNSAPSVTFVKRNRSLSRRKVDPQPILYQPSEHVLRSNSDLKIKSIKMSTQPLTVSEKKISAEFDESSSQLFPMDFNSSIDSNKNAVNLSFPKGHASDAHGISFHSSLIPKQTHYSGRWLPSNKTKIILGLVLFLAVCTVAILPPVLVLVVFRNGKYSGTSSAVSSSSSNQVCMGSETQYPITSKAILYPFDGNARDSSLLFSGTAVGTFVLPSYTSGGSAALAIVLNATQQQYVSIPFVDFRNVSFTLEVWVLPIVVGASSGIIDDFPIFGQCDGLQVCLLVTFRSGRIHLSFDSMGTNTTLTSSALLPFSVWTHVAIVYDVVNFQQLIYINGIVDTVSEGIIMPFQGSSSGAMTTIGLGRSAAYSVNTFNGMIDQFLITRNMTKTSCEIYNDAVLVGYFPFNKDGTTNDRSASVNLGITSGTTNVAGYLQEALLFSSASNSFFQSACYPNLRRTIYFTLSLWINPINVVGGGTIVHLSSDQNGNGTLCYDLFGMTTNGTIIVQIAQNSTSITAMSGPTLVLNTWTHLALVYSSRNGMRLYVNGILYNAQPNLANNLAFWSQTYGQLYVTLGNSQTISGPQPSCQKGSLALVPGAFSGIIDEFRLYMTELNGQEMYTLVNL